MMKKSKINLTFDFGTDPPESLKPKTNQLHGMTSVRNDLFWQAAISEIQTRIEAIEVRLEKIAAHLQGEIIQEEIEKDA